MGYRDKLKKLCALRGLDQSTLAAQVGLTKSSISRILNGAQEPKLSVAFELARALGVTLDYLVDDSPELGPTDQMVPVSDEELTILRIVRHLGPSESIDRLLAIAAAPPAEGKAAVAVPNPVSGARQRGEPGRGG